MSVLFAATDFGVRYDGGRGLEALAGVTMAVGEGERVAIIGESGSGKSTFALAVAGLLPANAVTQGAIAWLGLGETKPRPGRDIGFVFQDPSGSLDPVLSVGTQIVEVLRTHLGLSRPAARERAAALLGKVQLPEPALLLRAFPHQLSGGQRQRVAIAIAIAAGPKLLIADEATSALDTVVQAGIVALLGDLVREEGMSLLFVTHDIALASGLADRIAVFYAARLVEAGPAARVLAAPRHPYTAALIAAHLGLDTPLGRRLKVIPGSPPDPAAPPAGCRFAPRCPYVEARCRVEPAWRGVPGDGAACIHADIAVPA